MQKNINTLSFFSGGGGLDLGFAAAGFNIVYSSDIDSYSCKTLELNSGAKSYFGKHPVVCDSIVNVTPESIFEVTGLSKGKVDFVIGGPPCQAFSVFGKRKGLEDPRGNLVWEYARIIEGVDPEGFLFENVAGLKSIHGGSLYKELVEELSFNGRYAVSAYQYQIADYGIPQFRSRVIIIGSKRGVKVPKMEPTHGGHEEPVGMLPFASSSAAVAELSRPYVTVQKVLENMPEPSLEGSFYNHVGREHSERIVSRYQGLEFGERDPKTRINKLHPDRPSFAIIVGSDKGGGKGHVHPYTPREVTPRESARLQTFPDWWKFHGNGRHVIRQVGNAVPALFGGLLASHVAEHLFGCNDTFGYDQLVERLELDFLL
ncbi:DNA cytosine methyltransferase [Hymenobacter cavernae]|uniref:Cytosine-specific methyltransferase n=1 Tax=Hymenobacter cavernae TaxID=2044852 RepID=A0ABQ1UXT3_9BACT|nr:DNA cytosine methyltransferase [Hymenobacter cavernae]GGF28811.1 cytosine-specific methyltransferase [Hymenobacter cavernae]